MTKSLSAQWSQIQRKLVNFPEHASEHHAGGHWTPNTDMCEGADDIIIKVELAGINRDHLKISTENQVLFIEGVRRDPYGGESTAGYRFLQMEIEYGAFSRTLALPFPVDGDRAKAQLENGILKISLPRARSAGQTRITVMTTET
ncbi:MAG: Hsp20/alpha crystallin family protein [Lentisphaerota bacterium]